VAPAAAAARVRPGRQSAISEKPNLRIAPFTTEGTSGAWTVRWRIVNEGHKPIRLVSAIQPHSQFRTPETRLDRSLAPGGATDIALPVHFAGSPGAILENPFVILRFRESGDWRLLARVRVTAGPNGEPIAGRSVVATTQKAGTPD
jgi:hypothetical protein